MRTLLILLLGISTLAGAQTLNPNQIKRPTVNGTVNLNVDTDGYVTTVPKGIEAPKRIKIDPRVSDLPSVQSASNIRSFVLGSGNLPAAIELTDARRAGKFQIDPTDTTTPDDGAVTIVTASGVRYKRKYEGFASALWWGAVGDASDASAGQNTTAFTQAIAYVSASANAAANGSSPVYRDRPATLYIPAGTYYINEEVVIPGTIKIIGDGGLSYGGTFIYQRSSNRNVFNITGAADGGQSAVQIEDIRLRGHGSGAPSASCIYVASTVASASSLYFNRIWFQGWERFALAIGKSDDLQITNCTFDGAYNYCFELGSAAGAGTKVTNALITGNTIYGIRGGIAYLNYVDGLDFSHNRVYGVRDLYTQNTGFGLDALTGAVGARRVNISSNTFDHVDKVFSTRFDGFTFEGNTVTGSSECVVEIGGGSQVRYANITNNIISGVWSQTQVVGGVTVPLSPIYAAATGLRNSVITGNIIVDEGGSATAIYMPDSRTHFNRIDNQIDGFTTPMQIANEAENIATFYPKEVYRADINTASWSMGSYSTLVPVGTLVDGKSYLVKLYYNQPGTDVIAQAYTVTAVNTYAGAAVQTTNLTGNTYAYSGNAKAFLLRYLPGDGVVGLSASPSNSGMSGTLTVTIYQLAP